MNNKTQKGEAEAITADDLDIKMLEARKRVSETAAKFRNDANTMGAVAEEKVKSNSKLTQIDSAKDMLSRPTISVATWVIVHTSIGAFGHEIADLPVTKSNDVKEFKQAVTTALMKSKMILNLYPREQVVRLDIFKNKADYEKEKKAIRDARIIEQAEIQARTLQMARKLEAQSTKSGKSNKNEKPIVDEAEVIA